MHEANLRSTIARCGHHTSQRSLNASGVVCSRVIACTQPEAGFDIYVVEIAVCLGPILGSALIWPCNCSVLFKHSRALTVCASGNAKHSCTSSSIKLHLAGSKASASDFEQYSAAACKAEVVLLAQIKTAGKDGLAASTNLA